MEFVDNRRMNAVIDFLIHAWQQLGLPEQVQFDNGREFCGFGYAARFLSRVIHDSTEKGHCLTLDGRTSGKKRYFRALILKIAVFKVKMGR